MMIINTSFVLIADEKLDSIYAQLNRNSTVEDKVAILLDGSLHYKFIKSDLSSTLAHEALKIARDSSYQKGEYLALFRLCENTFLEAKFDEFQIYWDAYFDLPSLPEYLYNGQELLRLEALKKIRTTKTNQAALDELKKIADIARNSDNYKTYVLSERYLNIQLYRDKKQNLSLTVNNFIHLLNICKEKGYKDLEALLLEELTKLLIEKSMYKLIYFLNTAAMELYTEINNDFGIMKIHYNNTLYFIWSKKYNEALEELKHAITLNENIKNSLFTKLLEIEYHFLRYKTDPNPETKDALIHIMDHFNFKRVDGYEVALEIRCLYALEKYEEIVKIYNERYKLLNPIDLPKYNYVLELIEKSFIKMDDIEGLNNILLLQTSILRDEQMLTDELILADKLKNYELHHYKSLVEEQEYNLDRKEDQLHKQINRTKAVLLFSLMTLLTMMLAIVFYIQKMKDNKKLESLLDKIRMQNIALKTTQNSLTNVQSELKDFVNLSAHEFKESTRMINNYTSLMKIKNERNDYSDNGQYLKYIIENSERMNRFIDGLLIYSKSQFKFTSAKLNLHTIAKQTYKTYEKIFNSKNITVHIDDLPLIVGDEHLIGSFFVNLYMTSIQHKNTQEPTTVTLKSVTDKNKTTLMYLDKNPLHSTSSLITNPEIEYDSPKTLLKSPINLTICEKIVEIHKGNLDIDLDDNMWLHITAHFFHDSLKTASKSLKSAFLG